MENNYPKNDTSEKTNDDIEPSSYEPTIEDVLFGLSIVDNKIIFNKKSDWVEIHDGQIMNHGN